MKWGSEPHEYLEVKGIAKAKAPGQEHTQHLVWLQAALSNRTVGSEAREGKCNGPEYIRLYKSWEGFEFVLNMMRILPKTSNQENNMIWICFLKNYSSCRVENKKERNEWKKRGQLEVQPRETKTAESNVVLVEVKRSGICIFVYC